MSIHEAIERNWVKTLKYFDSTRQNEYKWDAIHQSFAVRFMWLVHQTFPPNHPMFMLFNGDFNNQLFVSII